MEEALPDAAGQLVQPAAASVARGTVILAEQPGQAGVVGRVIDGVAESASLVLQMRKRFASLRFRGGSSIPFMADLRAGIFVTRVFGWALVGA